MRRSCVRAPNRAQHGFDVSRIGANRHPHLDRSDHNLDDGTAALRRAFVRLAPISRRPHIARHRIGRQREAALLGRPDTIRQMLRSEIMPPRHVGNRRPRRNRLGNDSTLLLIAPMPAANHARHFRTVPNDIRVVINLDHNVHTICDARRTAIMHYPDSVSQVREEHRLRIRMPLAGSS